MHDISIMDIFFFGFQLVVYFVSDFCFSHEVGGVSQILDICFE